MHDVTIPEAIRDRVREQRGGSEHLYERLDLRRTAHIVIDMQNAFLAEGAPIEVPAARGIVGNVNRISAAVRAGGGTNAFLRFRYDPDEPQFWKSYYAVYSRPEHVEMTRDSFMPGRPGFDLWPALDVHPGDLVLDKTRYSAFIPGTCALEERLKQREIDTLIITGTLTNCCCESTARDAMQMGYGILFVSDGTAALTDAEHQASLVNLCAIFADVVDTARLLGVMRVPAPASA